MIAVPNTYFKKEISYPYLLALRGVIFIKICNFYQSGAKDFSEGLFRVRDDVKNIMINGNDTGPTYYCIFYCSPYCSETVFFLNKTR